jgi:hypothetical protein
VTNKTLPQWAFGVLSVIGVVLVGSMLLNWIDLGGQFTARGLSLAWNDNHWLFLVPLAGAVLIAAAATKSPYTRLAALAAGFVVTGYVLFNVSRSIVHSGLDTWLILGGAGIMLAATPRDRAVWRAIGGIAVLAGFFAPWVDYSMWKTLTSDVHVSGISGNILWLIPLAGITGIFASFAKQGPTLAAAAGITIYGTFLLVIGLVAYLVFGIGAWAAIGASACALLIGVVVQERDKPAPVTKPS